MSLKICGIGQESFTLETKMTNKRISSHLEGSVLGDAVKNLHKQIFNIKCSSDYFLSKGTQTDYRESECQTLPWEPPYVVAEGHNPEVLTLTSFTWGNGLPFGMHEMDIINRMRMRRAWEEILPPMDTPANIKIRTRVVTALEADEWAFREAEIQYIMNLRMELAEKLMESKENEKKKRTETRFKKLEETLRKRKQREIKNIKNKFSRELRKLFNKHQHFNKNHAQRDKRDSMHFYAGPDSEFQIIKPRYDCSNEIKQFCMEKMLNDQKIEEELPAWLFNAKVPKSYSAPKFSKQICSRYAQRKEKDLLKLNNVIEQIEKRFQVPDRNLLKKKKKPTPLPSTPCLSLESNSTASKVDHAIHFLQDLVIGRAEQFEFIEERNRNNDLIDELQATQELEQSKNSIEELFRKREEERIITQENRVKEILGDLEGKTIAKMLISLNEELSRLESDRKSHALVLLAEKTRTLRNLERSCEEEAAAIRRQELDDLFRQVIQVNRDSVDAYLEDVIAEGLNWASEREAERHACELAEKIDQLAKRMDETGDKIDEEGRVSDMIYNFVLPQVQKESAASIDEAREKSYLRAAHAAIYDEMLHVVENEVSSSITAAEDQVGLLASCPSEDEKIVDESRACRKGSLPRVIELILDYTYTPNERSKHEIYIILEEMLGLAKEKLNISD